MLEIYQAAEALHPNEMPVANTAVEDLDREYLFKVRPELRAMPEERFIRTLRNMRFLGGDGCLTIGGLLCSGRDPQAFVRRHVAPTTVGGTVPL